MEAGRGQGSAPSPVPTPGKLPHQPFTPLRLSGRSTLMCGDTFFMVGGVLLFPGSARGPGAEGEVVLPGCVLPMDGMCVCKCLMWQLLAWWIFTNHSLLITMMSV